MSAQLRCGDTTKICPRLYREKSRVQILSSQSRTADTWLQSHVYPYQDKSLSIVKIKPDLDQCQYLFKFVDFFVDNFATQVGFVVERLNCKEIKWTRSFYFHNLIS